MRASRSEDARPAPSASGKRPAAGAPQYSDADRWHRRVRAL